MEIIGKNIKRFREKSGLSQEQVGVYLGKKREQIAYYEAGTRQPGIDELEKLSDLFGVELSAIFEQDEAIHNVDLALSFRSNEISDEDLKQVAYFQKFVKNYLKVERLCNEQV
ncbi:MAG: hypothetical protein A2033_12890 [Bacteroidetes bacterium GWA2_31_9]|nr:MAG: hypothetical protein A2033_12890 [Bacteroidetes bacterium GWA2_31_9]